MASTWTAYICSEAGVRECPPVASRADFLAGLEAAVAESHLQLTALSKLSDNVFRVSGKTFAFLMPCLANDALLLALPARAFG